MTCARCQRDLPVMTYWPIGPVCQTCYTAILRSPAECARCNASHPLIAREEDGAGVCGPCVGHDADHTCRQCGRSGNPYGHGRCAFCVLADKVNDLFTGPDGTISPQLRPLADALIRTHAPFKAIQWVHEHPNAKLLAELATENREISHDLMDELPPAPVLQHLRQIMVQTGVLPERHEDLEHVPAWLDHHLADKPVEHAHLVRPFLHWFLLRRARTRASTRAYPTTVGRNLRRRVLVALDLLTWIDTQGTTLGDLRQDDLDRWLDEEERWQLLQRCLTDAALPIQARAAGALVLLFALQAQRIRHLTAEQLTWKGDDTYLTAGRHPMLLPPRLGILLRELASQPPAPLMIPTDRTHPTGCSPAESPDNHERWPGW
jgi:hypothetical protein